MEYVKMTLKTVDATGADNGTIDIECSIKPGSAEAQNIWHYVLTSKGSAPVGIYLVEAEAECLLENLNLLNQTN